MHRPSPAVILSLLALFFALGGSAFALGTRLAPQPRCAQGAVRGLVEITGQTNKSAANIPDHWVTDTSYLGRRFNCGGAIQFKRSGTGTFDVKFTGNPATSGLASAWGSDPAGATVARQPDGSFQVIVGSHSNPQDESFTLVVF
jgi:hypothetical protein